MAMDVHQKGMVTKRLGQHVTARMRLRAPASALCAPRVLRSEQRRPEMQDVNCLSNVSVCTPKCGHANTTLLP